MDCPFEKALRFCGDQLASLSPADRMRGHWCGDQFKSEADIFSHQILISELSKSFDLPVVSEEDLISQKSIDEEYIIIDPIDGTASFSHEFKGWVTPAALVKSVCVVAAGDYAPVLGEYY